MSAAADTETYWYLTDHLGTVRDVAAYSGGVTTIANHIAFDSFGRRASETDTALGDFDLGFTGKWLDRATGLQWNQNRWYNPSIQRWMSEDPIGFEGGDANLSRYVGNEATKYVDPSGLSPWKGISKILGKKWSEETAERAGKALATELLEKLARHRPDSQKAQEILCQLKGMGWVEEALGKGSKAGKTLDEGGGIILREMENGNETGRFLEWYPGGGPHHSDPHWKFSSGESGILKTAGATLGAIAVLAIPGAEHALAGDCNGAARQFVYEASPIGWGSFITDYFSWLYDSAYEDIYGKKPADD
jgi:RHS repeat-associated protein